MTTCFPGALEALRAVEPMRITGTVVALKGLTLIVEKLPAVVGSVVSVRCADHEIKMGEVVGFDAGRAIILMLGSAAGIRPGDRVTAEQASPTVAVGDQLLGRIIDGLGRPIDNLPAPVNLHPRPACPAPLSAMHRRRIDTALRTGVRSIDLMNAVGRGQRMGIFAGPGVGKSTLLGMIARKTSAEVSVIALVGERGREVRDFLEESLGEEGLARSVVVVATGDETPLMRVRACLMACAVAEYFRDQGRDVMLMVDSVTRLAHAQRQIGLAVGEPPTTKGYTPSVFALLPAILERAGAVEGKDGGAGGSITGFYTILVEGDDMTEPISDAARGILDGHLVLSRSLAQQGHFPAIDVLDSVSRVMPAIADADHKAARIGIIRLMAAYNEVRELVQIGAYAAGSSPEADAAIALKPRIDSLLRQRTDEVEPWINARSRLLELARDAEKLMSQRPQRRASA